MTSIQLAFTLAPGYGVVTDHIQFTNFTHNQSPLLLLNVNGLFCKLRCQIKIGPRQSNLVLIAYASSEGSGEPAHPRSLARTFAARSYKQ